MNDFHSFCHLLTLPSFTRLSHNNNNIPYLQSVLVVLRIWTQRTPVTESCSRRLTGHLPVSSANHWCLDLVWSLLIPKVNKLLWPLISTPNLRVSLWNFIPSILTSFVSIAHHPGVNQFGHPDVNHFEHPSVNQFCHPAVYQIGHPDFNQIGHSGVNQRNYAIISIDVCPLPT